MKNIQKIIVMASILITGVIFSSRVVHAQGMMGRFNNPSGTPTSSEASTAQDEAAGKVIYDKLQSKQTTCQSLVDDDFDVLGDYYMGQQLGSTSIHASMNSMMTNMMGEEGEKQMHIALGKRLSGCDSSAPLPAKGSNFLPMMGLGGMMGGASNNNWFQTGDSMMGFNAPYSVFGSVISVLIVIFLVLGIIYFWKGINKRK